MASTAAAVDLLVGPSSPKGRAAIGSALCAELQPKIEILARDIQDQDGELLKTFLP